MSIQLFLILTFTFSNFFFLILVYKKLSDILSFISVFRNEEYQKAFREYLKEKYGD